MTAVAFPTEANVTVEEFRIYAKATKTDATSLTEQLDAAKALLAAKVYVDKAPPALLKGALYQVALNLWQRRQSALERAGLGDGADTMPYQHRPALDPMTPAKPLLGPWLKPEGLA